MITYAWPAACLLGVSGHRKGGHQMKSYIFGLSLTVLGMGLMLSACNTTKATTDTTVNFFSSTTPNSLFTADGLVKDDQKAKLFAGVAFENLQQDFARGH